MSVAEITFIVIGVLLALAGNSWWQNRGDRQRELLNLRLLHAATLENISRVEDAIGIDSISLAMAEQVLAVTRTARSFPIPDSVADWAYRAAWFSDFHSLAGAYAALANNAELNLIRNAEVRAAIITMAGTLAGVEQQLRTYDAIAMTNAAALFKFFDVIPSAVRADPPWFKFGDQLLRSGSASHWAQLQASPDFGHALFMAWTNAANRVELLRNLRADLIRLLGSLDAELTR